MSRNLFFSISNNENDIPHSLLLLTGCGKTSLPGVDQVQPYVDKFKAANNDFTPNRSLKNVLLTFGAVSDASPDKQGECDSSGITPKVTIDATYWSTADDERR